MMRTRRRKDTKQNNMAQHNSSKTLSTTKAICMRMMADSMRELSTRLTRKRVKEKEDQIKLISDREIRLLRRNNDISISDSPSHNNGDTSTVKKDEKGLLPDDVLTKVPVLGTYVVESPSIHTNERMIPQ